MERNPEHVRQRDREVLELVGDDELKDHVAVPRKLDVLPVEMADELHTLEPALKRLSVLVDRLLGSFPSRQFPSVGFVYSIPPTGGGPLVPA